jgi:hypothetical protein
MFLLLYNINSGIGDKIALLILKLLYWSTSKFNTKMKANMLWHIEEGNNCVARKIKETAHALSIRMIKESSLAIAASTCAVCEFQLVLQDERLSVTQFWNTYLLVLLASLTSNWLVRWDIRDSSAGRAAVNRAVRGKRRINSACRSATKCVVRENRVVLQTVIQEEGQDEYHDHFKQYLYLYLLKLGSQHLKKIQPRTTEKWAHRISIRYWPL